MLEKEEKMEINDELIDHLENLSKLKLKSSEIEKMKTDMNEILEYMKLLDEVDVSGYGPIFTPMEDPMIPREDRSDQQDPSQILKLVPHLKDDLVLIPLIYAK
jgi:aspartyl-tRNA(Asn)/glutamyl-tRNA(Gln) amidotransferase subunit C